MYRLNYFYSSICISSITSQSHAWYWFILMMSKKQRVDGEAEKPRSYPELPKQSSLERIRIRNQYHELNKKIQCRLKKSSIS